MFEWVIEQSPPLCKNVSYWTIIQRVKDTCQTGCSFDPQPQPVTVRIRQILLNAKVSLGGLDAGMSYMASLTYAASVSKSNDCKPNISCRAAAQVRAIAEHDLTLPKFYDIMVLLLTIVTLLLRGSGTSSSGPLERVCAGRL